MRWRIPNPTVVWMGSTVQVVAGVGRVRAAGAGSLVVLLVVFIMTVTMGYAANGR
jgi:hypothetical protein